MFSEGCMNEAVSEAAARLERAVGRLAEAVAKPRPVAEPAGPAGVPPEQVAALAQRLDVSLAKLRGVLAELDAPEAEAPEPEASRPEGADLPAEPVAVEEDGLPSHAQPPAAHPEEER
ncbi:hypothetical protein ACFQU7_07315 [Pseudoroseomonas wenyumeiae]